MGNQTYIKHRSDTTPFRLSLDVALVSIESNLTIKDSTKNASQVRQVFIPLICDRFG